MIFFKLVNALNYGSALIKATKVPVGPFQACVCICDSGYTYSNTMTNFNYIYGTNRTRKTGEFLEWKKDFTGHGTHIASTINSNSLVYTRIGKINLFITRAFSDSNKATEFDIIDSMNQCIINKCNIISLSLSGDSLSKTFQTFLDVLYKNNTFVVAAAGNQGKHIYRFPASYNNVISVTAIDINKQVWKGSNYNDKVDFAAPGVKITGLGIKNNTSIWTGTSMATPFVAGAIALLKSHYPNCDFNDIYASLQQGAEDINETGYDVYTGHGLINTKKSWDLLRHYSCAKTIFRI